MSKPLGSTLKNILKVSVMAAVVATTFSVFQSAPAHAEAGTALTIESWRTGDETAWDAIIKAFEAANPDITVKFQPTNPPDYNAALNAKLSSGTAGDLITCRPFDAGYQLYQAATCRM